MEELLKLIMSSNLQKVIMWWIVDLELNVTHNLHEKHFNVGLQTTRLYFKYHVIDL